MIIYSIVYSIFRIGSILMIMDILVSEKNRIM